MSPSQDVKFFNVRGLFLRKYGILKGLICALMAESISVSFMNILDGPPHYVPDRRILFKKSLMVLKHPYGPPEVPCTPESHNQLLKKF